MAMSAKNICKGNVLRRIRVEGNEVYFMIDVYRSRTTSSKDYFTNVCNTISLSNYNIFFSFKMVYTIPQLKVALHVALLLGSTHGVVL